MNRYGIPKLKLRPGSVSEVVRSISFWRRVVWIHPTSVPRRCSTSGPAFWRLAVRVLKALFEFVPVSGDFPITCRYRRFSRMPCCDRNGLARRLCTARITLDEVIPTLPAQHQLLLPSPPTTSLGASKTVQMRRQLRGPYCVVSSIRHRAAIVVQHRGKILEAHREIRHQSLDSSQRPAQKTQIRNLLCT
jgi:hypothetical protein